ncbi:BMP family ABC transporter substrate-binding protein [Romboutsia sp. 1001216sp1]|uniref:BMP family lipoprotein n=1 Tax=Romboutsia TaxID=1501226 RepID=UPI000A6A35AF|nr:MULTISPECIES: BMP family ABC transporter substrate-binding protein [Romboutsia]MDB8791414.1 BMP family ABC transporter substrate-binding protein [Romboutsia sp. 1001216sp1]MDB8803130.1 BMP family ABC transporter substrate-binding protein [Romboutsia sp. 1001216sp1]MDB8814489.1 BMP family ABC transporter substrate-binding protein [Romboutsia sp. 1001216sp1]
MTFKKLVSLATVTALSASLLVGCSGGESEKKDDGKLKIAMVTDVAGVNDQSFNQSAWEGLEKAKKDLGVDVTYLESKQDSDYASNIETLVDQDTDLILGVGMKLAPAIEEAAKMYPDQKFALIDETYKEVPKNVEAVQFNSEQSAYLAGIVAGKMTKTNNVGFIGGMELPVIEAFQYGYMAGVKATNPEAKIQVQYANSFTDQAKGKAIAKQMYSQGADIIFTAGGDVGTGAIEAAKEEGKYAIGVDRDQSSLAPKNVLTSAIKRVDVGVYDVVEKLKEDKFEGGTTTVYGLKEGAVGLPESTKNLVPQDVMDYVNQQIEKFEKGELKAPKNEKEYNEMVNQ